MKQFAQIVYRRLRATSAFSPVRLFANGEIGAWYDPSDLTTMFQDSAGTTPVTAVGQAVGLILDKSQGLAIGSEIVTNGDFSNGTTGWAGTGGATLSVVSGALRITAASSGQWATTSVTTVVGRGYRVTFTLVGLSGTASTDFFVGSSSGGTQNGVVNYNSTGSKTFFFIATATTTYLAFNVKTSAGYIDVDNLSAKEIAGNHASQTTPTARPTLSARVNLLTYSEQFNNAAWTKTRSSISSDAAVAPDGTTTADKLIEDTTASDSHFVQQNATVINATQYTWTVYAKAAERSFICLYNSSITKGKFFNLSTGAVGTDLVGAPDAASITDAGNGWYRCSITFTTTGTSAGLIAYIASANGTAAYTGNGTSGILIWGADLRPADQVNAGMPNYQRIAAATDYDTTGFPLFLSFDGGDSLVTGTINPGSVDKAQIFAGVRKLSDLATGIITEFSANSDTGNAGSFGVGASSSNTTNYFVQARGSGLGFYLPSPYAAPLTNIISGIFDIAGASLDAEITPRVNGLVSRQGGSGAAGTGNFGSYPLYIGARAGSSLYFTGNLYGLIVRFSATNLADSVILQTEDWMDVKTFGKDMAVVYSDELTTALGELITAADGDQIYMTVAYV